MVSKIIVLFLFPLFFTFRFQISTSQTWIKGGYWYSGNESPVPDINSALFTHLICAFAWLNSSTYHIHISPSDEQYFSTFTDIVKIRNPSIITLLSIWAEKDNYTKFSSLISQPSNRKFFIESSIKTARMYGFHGLDLCGYRPRTVTDSTNMGILFDEWREAVRNSGQPPLILTLAVHYLPNHGSVIYQIDSLRKNIDWVHINAYDYHLPSIENFTHAHAALYDPLSQINTDFGIGEWIRRGFPAKKLVLGLPYHGYAWRLVNPKDNGIGAAASGLAMTPDGSVSYKYIKWYIRSYGSVAVYNATYVVNHCSFGATWIGYDDVEAIRTKVSYAKEKGLLGYNVWEVSHDENWVLSLAGM